MAAVRPSPRRARCFDGSPVLSIIIVVVVVAVIIIIVIIIIIIVLCQRAPTARRALFYLMAH